MTNRKLIKHLMVAVMLKLLVLAGLWWLLHQGAAPITADGVANHLAAASPLVFQTKKASP
jgi:multidrug resistance efflux pump